MKKLVEKIKVLWPYIKYRFFLSKLERKEFNQKDVVLFYLIPDLSFRAGGILSIYFLLDQTYKILDQATVLPATLTRLPNYTKIDWFKNDWDIYNIYYLKKQLLKSKRILVFVPECFYDSFCKQIKYYQLFDLAKKMKVVLLNQNDTLVPPENVISESKWMFDSLTMTLAFEANVSKKYSYLDGGPYFISSWFYQYTIDDVPYENKEQICIISPDDHPEKARVINILETECNIKCIEVKNMSFHAFQDLQRRAKWSVSFGEGYDNYFAGAFVKSGIGFCVYDPVFFPIKYSTESLPKTTFLSYEEMKERIVEVIKALDEKSEYEQYVEKMKTVVLENNSPQKVIRLLERFYANELSCAN